MNDDLELLIDLHIAAERQGPGGDIETQRAMNLAMLDRSSALKIADIGCGTGASTLQLARGLDASITAVDFLPEFLERLKHRVDSEGLGSKVETLACSMDDLPFGDDEYDVIWSEGAIYNMGFREGVEYWRRFLRPGGLLIVSEITWTSLSRPEEVEHYWVQQYSEIGTTSEKMNALEEAAYSPVAYFSLPEHCWRDNYYLPMQGRFQQFLSRNHNCPKARAIVAAEEAEIALYERFKDYYSYGVYIVRKPSV